jgi:GGDEF domain-containing protein
MPIVDYRGNKITFPDDMTEDEIRSQMPSIADQIDADLATSDTSNKKPKRTVLSTAKDVGISALKGAISVPESIVGLADLATGGRVGKVVENAGVKFKESKAILDDFKSDAQKVADQEFNKAEGFVDSARAAIDNPSVIANAGVESVAPMITGGVAARGLLAAAPKIGSVVAGALGEGVVGAGSAAEGTRQQTVDGLLTGKQAVASAASGAGTAILGTMGGKLAKKLGIGDIDTAIAGDFSRSSNKNFARRLVEGGITEGVFEELPQSIQEQMFSNYSLDKPLTEGVDKAAVMGLMTGTAFGAGTQLLPNSSAASKDKLIVGDAAADDAMAEQLQRDYDVQQKNAESEAAIHNITHPDTSIDEAIALAGVAVDSPLPKPTQALPIVDEAINAVDILGEENVSAIDEPAGLVADASGPIVDQPIGSAGDGLLQSIDNAGTGLDTNAPTLAPSSGFGDVVREGDTGNQALEENPSLTIEQIVESNDGLPFVKDVEIAGEPIDNDWTAFNAETGTLGIPRAEMPQIKAEHRGAMTNFLNARGIDHTQETVQASTLKPTQQEFSTEKVQKAIDFKDGNRSILVSADNHVLDGHHQWLAKLNAGEDIDVIRLNAPIQQLLTTVAEFPSASLADGATAAITSENITLPETATAIAPVSGPVEVAKIGGKNSTETISVNNNGQNLSVLYNGEPLLDYETEQEIILPAGATIDEIRKAVKGSGQFNKQILQFSKTYAPSVTSEAPAKAVVAPVASKKAQINTKFEANKDALRAWMPDMDWSVIGGRITRDDEGQVNGRTAWEPKDYDLDAIRKGSGLSYPGMQKAVQKALDGKPLSKVESGAIDAMIEFAETIKNSTVDEVEGSVSDKGFTVEEESALAQLEQDMNWMALAESIAADDSVLASISTKVQNQFDKFNNEVGEYLEQITEFERKDQREVGETESTKPSESDRGNGPASQRENGQDNQGQNQAEERRAAGSQRVDRRADTDTRKKVTDMSADEMRRALLIDDLTGIGNRRAYDESVKLPYQVSIDADGLKWINDNLGHDSGDKLLTAIGEALGQVTADSYHISGDEYVVQASTEEEAATIMADVNNLLANAVVEGVNSDGDKVNLDGIGISYGIAKDLKNAELKLQKHKSERETLGLRSGRGEQPANATVTSQRDENNQDNATNKSVQELAQELKEKYSKEIKKNVGIDVGISDGSISYISATFENESDAKKHGAVLALDFKEQLAISRRGGKHEAYVNLPNSKTLDLLGQDTTAQQALADAEKAKDAKRNSGNDNQDTFNLTGSEREADQAAAAGSQDLFAEAGKKIASVIMDLGEKIGGARKDNAPTGMNKSKRSNADDDRPTWAKRYAINQIADVVEDIGGKWTIRDMRDKDSLGQPRMVGGRNNFYDSKEAAEEALPGLVVGLKHRALATAKREDGTYGFEIYRTVNDRKRVKIVDKVFDDRLEALKYIGDNAAEILETNTTFGEMDLPTPDNTNRVGVARREGDVDGGDFMKAFGLRGVEFGNWNNQIERQQLMNAAYDGLIDLAEVLNIPTKALGLNGDLALAFGARGQGLSSAKAHYESNKTVINLTKMNGAGSLAHEWFHALDHYLGRLDSKASSIWEVDSDGTRSLKAKGADRDFASFGFSYKSNVRPEVREAYTKLIETMVRKAEVYLEDTNRADEFVARTKENLATSLDTLRSELSRQKDPKYWKRKNAPASAEQLVEFDTIAEQLLNGQGLDAEYKANDPDSNVRSRSRKISGRMTNDALEKLSALYKEVRGRSGFDSTNNNGVLDRLRGDMSRFSQRLKMLAEAQQGNEKIKQVPTEFAMNAKELDQGRGTDYWTTLHEMAARAFQGYVEDKVAETGGSSPFLNYGREGAGILTPWGVKFPFPRGAERKLINEALSNFVDALQTKETDTGVALFSRGGESIGMPKADVSTAVDSIKSKWANAPEIIVVDDMTDPVIPKRLRDENERQLSQGSAGQPDGFFVGGKVYVVASEMRDEKDIQRVIFHETLGHFGLRNTYGKSLEKILDEVYMARRTKVQAKAKEYGLDFTDKKDRRIAAEEVLAEMAQTNPESGLVKRAMAAIRQWLRDIGFDIELSDNDIIVNYLLPARHFVERGSKEQSIGDMVGAFARRDVTETEAFKKWFADSKVVDKDGKPLVVYHGTKANFETFKASKKIGNQGENDQLEGMYFTDSKDGASFYSQDETDPRFLKETFLSIKNPYKARTYKQMWDELGTSSNSEASRIIKNRGYDGIIIEKGFYSNGGPYKLYLTFEPNQIKSAIGNNGDFDGNNDDIRFSRQGNLQPQWQSLPDSKLDNVIRVLQDKNVDLKRVIESIKKAGNAIEDRWNAYLQEELYHGRTAKRTQDFIKDDLEPLIEDMRMRGVGMADFEEYLWMRHAEERNNQIAKVNPDMPDGGSGVNTADAKAYLTALPAADKAKYEALASRVDTINRKSRQVLIDYGIESADTIAAWEGAYKHYVPLMREDMDTGFGNGTGQGFSIKGSSTKRATGSNRAVVDIIANIAQQYEKNIIRGEKNRVATALIGLAKLNPNDDFWKVDTPPTIKDINKVSGLVEERTDPNYKNRDNVVVARIRNALGNVVERSVVFNEFDERAMMMAQSIKNLDQDDLGLFLGVASKFTRWFASVNTQYNPIFGFVNIVRDLQGSLLNLSTTPIAGKKAEVTRNVLPALNGIYQDLRAQRRGETIANNAMVDLFEEFQNVGGQTGYRDMFANAKARSDALRNALDPTWWQDTKIGKVISVNGVIADQEQWIADKAIAPIFDWLSDFNTAFENAVRLSVYKVALENGQSQHQAASLGKNISVNFNRKGQVGRQMGSLFAFFNASVQGTARIGETLTSKDANGNLKLSQNGKRIVQGGLLLGAMQAFALAAAGYDEDEPPEFVKNRNLVIPLDWMDGLIGLEADDKFITIPMPLGFNAIPSIGRIGTEFIMSGGKNPQETLIKIFEMIMEVTNPVGGNGSMANMITPTAGDPFIDLYANKDWTGQQISRDDFSTLKPTPGFTRSRDATWDVSVAMAKAINYATGGTDNKVGYFSPTADEIEYLVGQFTGGVGRETIKTGTTIESMVTGEELPTYKIPLVGRFYGDASGQASQGNEFYGNITELSQHKAEIDDLRKTKGNVQAYIKEYPEAILAKQADVALREVNNLRKRQRILQENGADHAKVKIVEDRITNVMKKFNERVQARKEKEAA